MRTREWWWIDPQVGRDHLLPSRPGLHADVEVVAVKDPADRLVEAEVLDRPRRERDHESVDRIDLSGLGVDGDLLRDPAQRRQLATAVLVEAVRERRPLHRPLPPGDAADVGSARAPDQPHVGVLQRLADLGDEIGIDDLGVLMDDDEGLEVTALLGLVEEQVVAPEDGPDRAVDEQLGIGLGGELEARQRAALVDLVLGDCAAERDHRVRSQPVESHAARASVNELNMVRKAWREDLST